ncbi:hypothetical protein PG996_008068 [Apiospora saccharicola]|uniref:SAP domain-containing protein n=1 Tax=Apiospora saccharicola TaxID=335842 RepID=A0ABR1UWU9_9PEZI
MKKDELVAILRREGLRVDATKSKSEVIDVLENHKKMSSGLGAYTTPSLSGCHAATGRRFYPKGEVWVRRLSATRFQGWSVRQVSCYTVLSGFRERRLHQRMQPPPQQVAHPPMQMQQQQHMPGPVQGPTDDPSKIYNGTKYERKQTEPFAGKLASNGAIRGADRLALRSIPRLDAVALEDAAPQEAAVAGNSKKESKYFSGSEPVVNVASVNTPFKPAAERPLDAAQFYAVKGHETQVNKLPASSLAKTSSGSGSNKPGKKSVSFAAFTYTDAIAIFFTHRRIFKNMTDDYEHLGVG